MTRGLGYKRDPPRPLGARQDFRAAARLGLDPIPDHADNSHLVLSVLDQGGMSSCVANAVCQAVRASMFRAAPTVAPPPLGSRMFVYWFARAYSHETNNDSGTYIRDAFAALNKFGLPPESAMPYVDDGKSFAKMPPGGALRAAYDQHSPTAYYRIDETGYARLDAVKRALAQGFLVPFGTLVSNDFCAGKLPDGGLVLPPVLGPIAGGHAMAIVGFDDRGSAPHFTVVNSWGEGWGNADPGFWLMSPEYLMWTETTDLWLAEAIPAFSEVKR